MDLNKFLEGMLALKASDLYITVGAPILFRVDGELRPQGDKLSENDVALLLDSAMDPGDDKSFAKAVSRTLPLSVIAVASVSVPSSNVNYREPSFVVLKPIFQRLSSLSCLWCCKILQLPSVVWCWWLVRQALVSRPPWLR